MAYAISRENAEKAPIVAGGEAPYVEKFLLRGTEYYVYVHRFSSSSLINSLKLLLIYIVSVGFSCCSTFCHLSQKYFLAFLKRTRRVVS
jgi:apyrase